MADEPDELLLTDVLDQVTAEEPEAEATTEVEGEEPEELEVMFGDEAAPASDERDTGLTKHLREEIRRRDKELADLRRSVPQQPQRIEVGPKPTLIGCEYDEDRFDQEYEQWQQRKALAARSETEAQTRQREQDEAWHSQLRTFEGQVDALKFADSREAVQEAIAVLTPVQQAVVVKTADNSALVMYSLAKHPSKLAEIAAIQDPLLQAKAIVKLEGQLKVTNRRAPAPERIAGGSAPVAVGEDKTLARLTKEANASNDFSKVFAHQRAMRAAKSAKK
jgi:hypothetical protein